jgi:ribosome-binding factor A
MGKRANQAPSQRQLRVGEELRHTIAQVIERGALRDPDLADVPITITEVRIGPDLRNATVFVAPLGGSITVAENQAAAGVETEAIVAAMQRAASFLRRSIAKSVHLKYAPNLTFEADTSFDYADNIDRLLGSVGPREEQ